MTIAIILCHNIHGCIQKCMYKTLTLSYTDDSPLQHQATPDHSVEKVFSSAQAPACIPDVKPPAHGTCISMPIGVHTV